MARAEASSPALQDASTELASSLTLSAPTLPAVPISAWASAAIRLFVAEVSVGTRLHAKVVVAVVVGINNDVPIAVQADGGPVVGVDQQSWLLIGRLQDH